MSFFKTKTRLVKDIDMFSSKKIGLNNIITKFTSLAEEAKAFVEQNKKKIYDLEVQLNEAQGDQKTAETIAENLNKFIGRE